MTTLPNKFVHYVHPNNERAFREVASSRDTIRQVKDGFQGACSWCTKPSSLSGISRCARCKMAMYCSRECQKKDWPGHKLSCKEATSPIPRLLSGFMANPVLILDLHTALAIMFNIATIPANPPPPFRPEDKVDKKAEAKAYALALKDARPNPGNWDEVPFIAQCTVDLEPCDYNDVSRVLSGEVTDVQCATIEGRLHLRDLCPSEFSAPPIPPASVSRPRSEGRGSCPPYQGKTRLELWRNAKTLRDQNPNKVKYPICVLDFVIPDANQLLTFVVPILSPAIVCVEEGRGCMFESAMTPGLRWDVPLSVDLCLQWMNNHIRDDKKNQLRLRTGMTKELLEIFLRRHHAMLQG